MSDLVIVAIPAEDDYVWKISSEKVPHMTILNLGDLAQLKNFAKVADYVSHAAETSLNRFGLEVDHRGTLGIDNADVLFFSKTRWSGMQDVVDFHTYLLQDSNIRTAYDSSSQFDGFTPHLTLGYPETPAKPDNRDYPGITYVQFDKIGLWFNDYAGLEFPLTSREYMDEVAMDSLTVVDAVLAHHGVRGMKWGVRRSRSASSDVSVSTSSSRRGKARVKTSGGEGHAPHPDAIRAKVASQKIRKSGTHALSNEELQTVITRMNLEQQIHRLGAGANTYQRGTKTVGEILKQPEGKLALQSVKSAAKSKHVRKVLATAGSTAALATRR